MGDEPWQADPARRLVTYPLDRLDGWTIAFETTDEAEVEEGSTRLQERRIVIRVPAAWSAERAANALAHELGHVHDVLHLTARRRDDYLKIRGLTWRERYVTVGWPSFSDRRPRRRQRVGCEDFAEVFALRWGPPAAFVGTVRPAPGPDELARLEPYLRPPDP